MGPELLADESVGDGKDEQRQKIGADEDEECVRSSKQSLRIWPDFSAFCHLKLEK